MAMARDDIGGDTGRGRADARGGRQPADGGDEAAVMAAPLPEGENPLETDFFKALNAFRAARHAGDATELARAEERLREVVRGELTGEGRP